MQGCAQGPLSGGGKRPVAGMLLATDRVAEWVSAVSGCGYWHCGSRFPCTILLGLETGDIRVLHPNAAAPAIARFPACTLVRSSQWCSIGKAMNATQWGVMG